MVDKALKKKVAREEYSHLLNVRNIPIPGKRVYPQSVDNDKDIGAGEGITTDYTDYTD